MAINLKVAKRYSKGLFDFAVQTKKQDEVYAEMKQIQQLIFSSKDLKNFLTNPILDAKKKTQVASVLFKSFSEVTQKFISLVIKQKREANLVEIAQAYQSIYENFNNIVKVSLITATDLDTTTKETIYKESRLIPANAKTILQHQIDESLIGGFILRVGDQQVDTSIKTRLLNLRKNFNKNLYEPSF